MTFGRVRVREDVGRRDGDEERILRRAGRRLTRAAPRGVRLTEAARRHWLFVLLLALGLALRVVVSVVYDPALLRPDSVSYLRVASEPPRPWGFHPIGYPMFLRLLPYEWTVAVISAAQHVLGLAVAVLLYVLLLRLAVPRLLGALAVAPVLLDAYQLNIEQHVLSETLFQSLLVGGCVLLLWGRPLGVRPAAFAGLLFAAAALTRTIGAVAILPAVAAAPFLASGLPLRRRLLRPVVTLGVFAVPLVGYAAWFAAVDGRFTLTTHEGKFLYGRVAPFADCSRFAVPEPEQILCPKAPPGERRSANSLLWGRRSLVNRVEVPPGERRLTVVGDFSKRVIRHQPLDYVEAVSLDFLRIFRPIREHRRDDVPLVRWQFQPTYSVAPPGTTWGEESGGDLRRRYERRRADPAFAGFLVSYQRFGYIPGPVLAAALLASLAAVAGVGRAGRSGLRAATFLLAATAILLAVGSIAATLFNWRYQIPLVVLLPPAGAVALTALLGGGRPCLSAGEDRNREPDRPDELPSREADA